MPGAAAHVLGRIETDAKDPGPQVDDRAELVAGVPAFDKRFLGGVLGVFLVAQDIQQRAQQFVAQLVKGAHQSIRRRTVPIGPRLRTYPDRYNLVGLRHSSTAKDENEAVLVWT